MGVRLPPEYQEVDWIGSNNDAYLVIKNAVGLPETTNLKVKTTVLWKNVLSRQIHGRNGRCYFGVAGGYYQNTQTGTGHTQIEAVANEWASVEWSRNDSVCTLKVGNDIDITNSTITTTGSMPFALFALGDGSIRCYCALKETQVEIGSEQFDLIPCYRKQDSKPGMYDLASDTFFVNQGSREFDIGPDVIDSISPLMVAWRQAMMSQKQPRLPIAYQEVGYIGSTVVGSPNRSWIDTLIYPTNETDIRLVYSGYYQNPNPWQSAKCFVDARDGNKRYELNDATFNFGASWNSQWNHNVPPPESGTLEIVGGKLYLDGVLKLDKSDQIFTLNSTLALFTSRNDSTRQNKFNLISLKAWQSSDLIGDFVPCYRKSDHKPGLYDLVSSQFFVNQGDVEFIVGQNIN